MVEALPAEMELEETPCPLCGSDDRRPLRSACDLYYGCPGVFQIVRCAACGHVYVNPRPTPASIGRYYPAEYAPYYTLSHREAGSASGAAISPQTLRQRLRAIGWIRRLYETLVESRGHVIPQPVTSVAPRALELGCAGGAFLETLRRQGWDVVGVEPSPVGVEQARRRGFEVHQGTLAADSFPANQFDAIFAWMVLEHVHQPRHTLQTIRTLLKPGGAFAFSVPNFGCWVTRLAGRFALDLDLPRHLQHFTPQTLKHALQDAGFEQVQIIHQRNLFHLVGSLGLWLRSRYPRKHWGDRLIHFVEQPRAGGLLALAPLSWLFALIHQGGRLTVVARKPVSSTA